MKTDKATEKLTAEEADAIVQALWDAARLHQLNNEHPGLNASSRRHHASRAEYFVGLAEHLEGKEISIS